MRVWWVDTGVVWRLLLNTLDEWLHDKSHCTAPHLPSLLRRTALAPVQKSHEWVDPRSRCEHAGGLT